MKGLIKILFKCILPKRLLVYRINHKSNIYLTFDDGPNAQTTPRLLALLEKYQVQATFFVVGEVAEKEPTIINDIANKGHALANHSYSHTQFSKLPLKEQLNEIVLTNKVIEGITKLPTKLFRPPQGRWSFKLLFKIYQMKMSLIHWSRDSLDCRNLSASEIITNFKNNPVKPGDIVLFHDDDDKVIVILEELLPMWQTNNIQFSSIN